MTNEQLDEIEKLHAAATPGRWSPAVWQGNDDTGGWAAVGPHQESTDCICEGEEDREACHGEFCADDRSQNDEEQALEDAKAIAALHNAFPAMANALREARAEVAKVREVMRQNTFDCEEEVAAAQLRAAEWRRDANRYARELSDARAAVERLRVELQEERALACEEPNPKCSCPGCSYAREKAALKEGEP